MTGYGNRFIGGFKDADGATISLTIQQKDYTGSTDNLILTSDTPIIISKPSGDLLTHIFGTGCKINIVNNGEFLQYSELFGTPERQHYVVITRNDGIKTITLFEGFVLPQLYSQSLNKNATITIPANDQLSNLNNFKPTILEGNDNYVKIIDLVKEIVWSTGLENPIYVKSGLYNEIYTSTYDNTITPFEETYVDKSLYIEDDGEPTTADKILTDILKIFGSRLYYRDRKWFIDRVKNFKSHSVYKVFNANDTTSSATIPYTAIDLNDEHLINGSNSVEYEVGVKTYEMGLNMDLFDNLIDPNFLQITEATTIDYYGIPSGGAGNIIGGFTYPNKYQWVHNIDTSLDSRFIFNYYKYKDSNLTNGGIMFSCDSSTDPNQVRPILAAISTKISVDYKDDKSQSDINLKVSYKHSMLGSSTFINNNNSYRSVFTIRVVNSLGAFRTLYFDSAGKLNLHNTTITNPERLVIETTTTADDIKNTDNPSTFIINKDIPIGEVMEDLKTFLNTTGDIKFIDFYIDFYLLQEDLGSGWHPIPTKIGDINVYCSVPIEENVIEATIEDNYNGKLSLDLDLYDYQSVSIKNSLYLLDNDVYIPSGYHKWKEDGYTYERYLQYIYLVDLVQNYNQNRYKLSVITRPSTISKVFNLNNIFTYSYISKNSSRVDMLCMGYDYNLKSNTYNLQLQEWTDDDGYHWEEDLGVDPKTLTVAPMYFEIPSWGSINTINVTSNTDWIIETLSSWIILNKTEGFGNGSFNFTVYSLDNPADGRIGTITVSTIGGTIVRTIDVEQSSTFDDDYSEI